MWQQLDCDAAAADKENGWGCKSDLFPWVETATGVPVTTGQGSTAMGFYNVQQGDAPYFKELADFEQLRLHDPTVKRAHHRRRVDDKGISWAYYGDQCQYLIDKYQLGYNTGTDEYCNICNFEQYATSIMTNPASRRAHLKDTEDFYDGIQKGELPAVSFVKPSGWVDGHPNSSKLNLFEGYVKKIVDDVKANPKLWNDTAILVTFDEGAICAISGAAGSRRAFVMGANTGCSTP